MSFADDLVWAVADRMAHGDGPRPESPEDTQRTGQYLDDARDAVATTLRTLAEQGYVLANVRTGGHPTYPSLLASAVERGGRQR